LIHCFFICATLSFATDLSDKESWPGWRGPDALGVGTGSPPTEWSEQKNVRFKVEIPGNGLSCPVVHGGFVYLTTAVPTGKAPPAPENPPEENQNSNPENPDSGQDAGSEGRRDGARGFRPGRGGGGGGAGGGGGGFMSRVPPAEQDFIVLAVSRRDGSIAWKQTLRTATPHEGTHGDGSFATPTIATDGEHLIVSFGSNGIFGLTMDGKKVWEKDFGDMSVQGSFGEGSSPVMHSEVVIINWDHEGDSFVVALDKKTGDELWRRERPRGTSWTTPLVVEVDAEPQVIVSGTRTVAYALETGDEIWSFGPSAPVDPPATELQGEEGESSGQPAEEQRGGRRGRGGRGGRGGGGGTIASPVAADGFAYVTGSERGGGVHAIDLEYAEGVLEGEAAFAWSESRDVPSIPSPIVYQGLLYMLKANSGMVSAFDAKSGERMYGPTRLSGVSNAYASPVAAGGRLYFSSREGTVEVISAGNELTSLAVNTLDDQFDASPAIVGDELYLRGHKHLYCIAEN